jgi:hypothetical protein
MALNQWVIWLIIFIPLFYVCFGVAMTPVLRRKYPLNGRVEFVTRDGRVQYGFIAERPSFSSPTQGLRIRADGGDVLVIRAAKVKPLKPGDPGYAAPD